MHHELLLLVLAVTGVFSRCSQATDPIDVQGETSVPTTEDGGAGGEGGEETSTSTSSGTGGEGGVAGAGGQGGEGGEGGAGGSGGEGGAGGEGGGAVLGAIGAPCFGMAECVSGVCMHPPSGPGLCTASCSTDADCGDGAACSPVPFESGGRCLRTCEDDVDCAPPTQCMGPAKLCASW